VAVPHHARQRYGYYGLLTLSNITISDDLEWTWRIIFARSGLSSAKPWKYTM